MTEVTQEDREAAARLAELCNPEHADVLVPFYEEGGDSPLAEAFARHRLAAIEWQPIETAPKDGTWVLVGCWVEHEDGTREWSAWAEPSEEGLLGCDGRYGDECTHWQPLPPPPRKLGEQP